VKKSLCEVIVSSDELTPLANFMINNESIESNKPKLIIAFTSDRGLCGGFNQSIIRMIKSNLISSEETKIIAIGKRIVHFINTNYSDNLVAEYINLEINDKNINELADNIISMINDNSISSCDICFNFFKNALVQTATQKKIIPFTVDTNAHKTELVGEDVLNKLLRLYIIAEIKYAFLNSVASEEAARTTAMDNATRNAGDLIEDLTLAMNRQRQSAITSELTEIISGAEAV